MSWLDDRYPDGQGNEPTFRQGIINMIAAGFALLVIWIICKLFGLE